jgi:hypothetical protein
MLTKELREKLVKMMKNNPQAAIKELERDPQLLELLLNSQDELERAKEEATRERAERIKYVNMTGAMEQQLREQAARLNTTQGLLLGAGLLFLLSNLEEQS